MAVKDRNSYKKMVQILIVKIFLSSIHHDNDNDFFSILAFIIFMLLSEKLKKFYMQNLQLKNIIYNSIKN